MQFWYELPCESLKHSRSFEYGVVNLCNRNVFELSFVEKAAVQSFLNHQNVRTNWWGFTTRHKSDQKKKVAVTEYTNFKWIPATSNAIELLHHRLVRGSLGCHRFQRFCVGSDLGLKLLHFQLESLASIHHFKLVYRSWARFHIG